MDGELWDEKSAPDVPVLLRRGVHDLDDNLIVTNAHAAPRPAGAAWRRVKVRGKRPVRRPVFRRGFRLAWPEHGLAERSPGKRRGMPDLRCVLLGLSALGST